MQAHYIRFLRAVDEPGIYRGVCSCGWSMTGEREEVQARAATHDLDEQPGEPPLLHSGFVSGLSD